MILSGGQPLQHSFIDPNAPGYGTKLGYKKDWTLDLQTPGILGYTAPEDPLAGKFGYRELKGTVPGYEG
jgi:hypothetical protein